MLDVEHSFTSGDSEEFVEINYEKSVKRSYRIHSLAQHAP